MDIICDLLLILVATIPLLWGFLVSQATRSNTAKGGLAIGTVIGFVASYLLGAVFILASFDVDFSVDRVFRPCRYLINPSHVCLSEDQ